jgi:hypothetical protein
MRSLVAALAGVLLLAGCGSASDDTAAPTGTGPTSVGSDRTRFLELTAQHVCEVQGQVYPDAAALADAFETAPEYPGIPADRVQTLTRRLETDPGFARALNGRIADTCGRGGSAD